ncbi:MAG: 3-phosphoshikimate 1-carboxyvinyltransferase, partial [Planctomycetota bacterium]
MKFLVRPGTLHGNLRIPGSKSHTIRGLLIGTLACGTSVLRRPLRSADTESCIAACRALGAEVDDESDKRWEIHGTAGRPDPRTHGVDVGNSGTTFFLALTAAALGADEIGFDGDEQLRRRSAGPLAEALRQMGADVWSRNGDDCPPISVCGPIRGGSISIECPTSQYLSSLLIGCPLAEGDSDITVPLLNESPYVEMTCDWLRRRGIRFEAKKDFRRVLIPGGQHYADFEAEIPADFSSATFFLVAAAVTSSELFLHGLDMNDTQGDKAVVWMLEEMGCEVETDQEGIRISGPEVLAGGEFDLNATPDALPAMAVAGCLAEGETRLVNVPQARDKETDRISAMAEGLRKMGGEVEELEDGMVLRGTGLSGAEVHGRGDHRIAMALAVAGLAAEGRTEVETAECVSVTFPTFADLMR